MQKNWSTSEISKLKRAYESKPSWVTENDFAGKIAKSFKRSPESIRWQLRMFRKEVEVASPKILLLDIETLPIEAKVWGVWNQNIQPFQIKKDWSIVCWSAKWLFDKEAFGLHVSPEEAVSRKEASILGPIWEALNQAQMVITHNGDEFDLKKLNTKFLLAGMPKPNYSKSIDTLTIAKKNFAFTYNKMGWINELLGIGTKMETSFKWWDEASEGNEKYLDLMLEYNKQDVHILEELYLKLRPWMSGHPNMAVYSVHGDVPVCPTCGSIDLNWSGLYSTPLGLYKSFRCQMCGSIGRSTKKQYKVGKAIAQN